MKISVVIVTRNSALHLARTLECVKTFSETVIVDMGSTDDTLAIARDYGCRVVPFEPTDGETVEDARNFSLQYVRYEWVLMIEPNELVPNALRDYLYDFIASGEGDGLFVPRKNFMMYRFHKGAYPDYRPRLFRRNLARWTAVTGSFPMVDGEMKTIPAARQDLALVHLSTRFVRNMGHHGRALKSSLDQLRMSDRKISLSMMLFAPMWTFLRTYFFRGTLFYGKDGFVFACHNATDHFITLADIHEHRRMRQFNKEHENTGIHIPVPENE